MRVSNWIGASVGVLGACLVGGVPVSALAQASVPQNAPVAAETPTPDRPTNEDIIVTGSRVIRNGDAAPQPITVVNSQDLLKIQPTTLADGLNSMPVFAGSRGPSTSTTSGAGTGGNSAANQLNMRNLGANRNLILLDGQRVPAALFTGVVDIDIIPDMLIQRVDVVTGGVSAVYGSDAVSGVVNFVTDKSFKGFKTIAQAGISGQGDAPSWKIGGAYGTPFADGRGHFEASYAYFSSNPLWYRTDRPFGYDYAYGGAGTAASPYVIYSGTRNTAYSYGGYITSGALKNQNFAQNGVISPFNFGTPTGAPNLSVGGDGAYQNASMGASQRSHQIFTRLDFDVSDDIKFHLQGLGSIKGNKSFNNYLQMANYTISACNAFLSSAIQTAAGCTNAAYTATGQPTFTFSKMAAGGPRLENDVQEDQYYINGGLDGKFSRFDWGVDANYGWTTLHNAIAGNVNNQRLAAATDAVVDPSSGQVVCRSTLTNPTANPGCVAFNVFGPSAGSQAAYNYVYNTTNLAVRNSTLDLDAHIGGPLFDLGAGDARFALSGEYRRNTFSEWTDYPSSIYANCTGLRYNCSAGSATSLPTTLYQQTVANRPQVSQVVKEGALEVNVPLLKDSAIGKLIEINGAVRYTDYNTSGKYWTWKGGFNYQIFNDLRLRGTLSRDIRAPTLYDLFQAPSIAIANNPDLVSGVTSVPALTTGNPDLKAEIGKTFTAGFVYKPHAIRGLSLAVDYYNIRISNAIVQIQGFDPSVQAACVQSNGASPYCALAIRSGSFASKAPVTEWLVQNVNVAQQTTWGFDGELNYATRLFNRPASLRLFTTWQPHLRYYQPGLPIYDAGGAANGAPGQMTPTPAVRINGMVHVEPTSWMSLDVRERWRSGMRYNANPTLVFAQRIAPVGYTDLTATFKVPGERFEMFVNVQNLWDKSPPASQYGTLPGQGFAGGDDFIGRYFTVGVRSKF